VLDRHSGSGQTQSVHSENVDLQHFIKLGCVPQIHHMNSLGFIHNICVMKCYFQLLISCKNSPWQTAVLVSHVKANAEEPFHLYFHFSLILRYLPLRKFLTPWIDRTIMCDSKRCDVAACQLQHVFLIVSIFCYSVRKKMKMRWKVVHVFRNLGYSLRNFIEISWS